MKRLLIALICAVMIFCGCASKEIAEDGGMSIKAVSQNAQDENIKKLADEGYETMTCFSYSAAKTVTGIWFRLYELAGDKWEPAGEVWLAADRASGTIAVLGDLYNDDMEAAVMTDAGIVKKSFERYAVTGTGAVTVRGSQKQSFGEDGISTGQEVCILTEGENGTPPDAGLFDSPSEIKSGADAVYALTATFSAQ